MPKGLITILLLIASNSFMTIAWYGHLKFKNVGLVMAVLISWGIALIEYSLIVGKIKHEENLDDKEYIERYGLGEESDVEKHVGDGFKAFNTNGNRIDRKI
jgi:hypothetical protein